MSWQLLYGTAWLQLMLSNTSWTINSRMKTIILRVLRRSTKQESILRREELRLVLQHCYLVLRTKSTYLSGRALVSLTKRLARFGTRQRMNHGLVRMVKSTS